MSAERLRKMFIGGLGSSVTEEDLRQHFEHYGMLVSCYIIKDTETGRSKGYGFLTYSNPAEVDAVQADRPHHINGRLVVLKRAFPKRMFGQFDVHLTVNKLFVEGIPYAVDEEDLRAYFERFGNVINVDLIVDHETNRSRGFGFIEFDDYDPVDKIVLLVYHHINGRSVEVRKAMTKREMRILRGREERNLVNSFVRRQDFAQPYGPQ